MTIRESRRIHPVAARAYTLPIVREIPSNAGQESSSGMPEQFAQPRLYPADAHAW
jgi:hypothetical protein